MEKIKCPYKANSKLCQIEGNKKAHFIYYFMNCLCLSGEQLSDKSQAKAESICACMLQGFRTGPSLNCGVTMRAQISGPQSLGDSIEPAVRVGRLQGRLQGKDCGGWYSPSESRSEMGLIAEWHDIRVNPKGPGLLHLILSHWIFNSCPFSFNSKWNNVAAVLSCQCTLKSSSINENVNFKWKFILHIFWWK